MGMLAGDAVAGAMAGEQCDAAVVSSARPCEKVSQDLDDEEVETDSQSLGGGSGGADLLSRSGPLIADELVKNTGDQVSLQGVMSVTNGEKFSIQGTWMYKGAKMGSIVFSSAVDDVEACFSQDGENERNDDDDDAGLGKSSSDVVVPSKGPGLSVSDGLVSGQQRLFTGHFTMANPQYSSAKKKKRAPKKNLSVSEKFLLRVQSSEGLIECNGEGVNRFGGFSIRATIDTVKGTFLAIKEYWPKTNSGEEQQRQKKLRNLTSSTGGGGSSGKRRSLSKSDSALLYGADGPVRSSKRQRVPNKLLQLDPSGPRNYAFIARYGNGEGLSAYEYALATGTPYVKSSVATGGKGDGINNNDRCGSFSPSDTAQVGVDRSFDPDDKQLAARGLAAEVRRPLDAARKAKVRKKAKQKTATLVRALLQYQANSKLRQLERESSGFSASSLCGDSSLLSRRGSDGQRSVRGQLYEGGMQDGARHGFGLLMFQDGSVYEGEWDYGRMHGKGIFLDPAGNLVYQGGFCDGYPSGCGTYCFSDGGRYDGELREGAFHGRGRFFDAVTGATYTGDWVRGKRQGFGSMYFKDGSTYVGEWQDNQWNGRGEMQIKGALSYEGTFKANKFDGRGLCKYEGAGSFEGNFRMGMKEGRGSYAFDNGAIYEGRFSHDKSEGFGTLEMRKHHGIKVNDEEWVLPVKMQSTMKFVNRAAGF